MGDFSLRGIGAFYNQSVYLMGEKIVYRPMCDLLTGLWYVQRGWRRIDGTTHEWETIVSTGEKHEEGYNAAKKWIKRIKSDE